MSFPRHEEIYRSDALPQTWGPGAASRWSAPGPSPRARRKERALLIVRDEFPVGYSLASCSPAEPASASPTALSMSCGLSAAKRTAANGNLSLISVPHHRGSVQSARFLSRGHHGQARDLAEGAYAGGGDAERRVSRPLAMRKLHDHYHRQPNLDLSVRGSKLF